MTDAKTILEMIEKIEPTDWYELEKIDEKVYLYTDDKRVDVNGFWGIKPYTRSRDALKSIRPPGWVFNMRWQFDQETRELLCEYSAFDSSCSLNRVGGFLSESEELAELHAIVQAIEFERSKCN